MVLASLFAMTGCGGCGQPRAAIKPSDSGAADANATADAGIKDAGFDAAGPEAANELLIKRFEDETPSDKRTLVVKKPSFEVVTTFPRGELVASLKQGDSVVQLAERNGFYRVVFPDPKAPERKLMAWASSYGFVDPVGYTPGVKIDLRRCPYGTAVAVMQSGQKPRCDFPCNAASECANRANCEAAILIPDDRIISVSPSYTAVCTPLPDATKTPPSASNQIPSLFGTTMGAGGKCPQFFTAAPKVGKMCYRSCKTDKECPVEATCKSIKGTKLCSVN
jgi:hypothetical protein